MRLARDFRILDWRRFQNEIDPSLFREWFIWYVTEGLTREPHYEVMATIYNSMSSGETIILPEHLESFTEDRPVAAGNRKMIDIDEAEKHFARIR